MTLQNVKREARVAKAPWVVAVKVTQCATSDGFKSLFFQRAKESKSEWIPEVVTSLPFVVSSLLIAKKGATPSFIRFYKKRKRGFVGHPVAIAGNAKGLIHDIKNAIFGNHFVGCFFLRC